ncbi:hypothetical protein HPB50_020050 [Hyalomma asiaticum]|uniref:Uncharacterized protein n=1 Tax=Hyalomma asiaticum TaxID=266040 RepID=A0ACB7RT32_HYAAI|nr:hypothetical protein HPB50_020050 [Hyalomma asiaticum]
MDRVSAEPVCDVVYPKKPPALRQKVGRLVRVPFEDLERTLSGAYECQLVTHVQMRVYSFLCLSGDTDPTTSPLVQLIHKAPALATVAITVDDYCCSECWNKIAPPLCDAILHNKGVHAFEVNLPKKADMQLLPLAELLQCNPSLYRFALKPPGPKAFRDFLRKAAKKKLWDNCNLAIVDLKYSGQDMQKEKLLLQNVVDRNCKLAMRAARFVGGARSMENAEALKKVFGSQFLVKKVCDALQENRQQALRRIATCLEEVTDGKPT